MVKSQVGIKLHDAELESDLCIVLFPLFISRARVEVIMIVLAA